MIKLFAKKESNISKAKYFYATIMLLLSTYICTLLRGIKDSILIPRLGTEEISFIKFYGVMPVSIIFFIIFFKLANLVNRENLYKIIISFFTIFFSLYIFLILPYEKNLNLNLTHLLTLYSKYKYPIRLLENWSLSIFYIISEICGTVILTMIFWQFANDIFSVKEAQNNYAALGIVGQFGIILAGIIQNLVSEYIFINQTWCFKLQVMLISIIISLLILLKLYQILFKKFCFNRKEVFKVTKLSFIESIKLIFSSFYLWLIMLIVLSYGLSANLIDILWKTQLKIYCQTHDKFSSFIGKFNIILGFISILFMLLRTIVMRKFKWLIAAIFAPIFLGITGIFFILSIKYQNLFNELFNIKYLMIGSITIFIGSAAIILFKSLNYAFIDPSKEIAFIPLNPELKVKGKAAIDILGGRLGKGAGAIIQQTLLQFAPLGIINLTDEILVIFIICIIIWVAAVILLSKSIKNFKKVTT